MMAGHSQPVPLLWSPSQDFPWILADEQDVHMHDPRLIPLKTMTSDILKVRCLGPEFALFRVC